MWQVFIIIATLIFAVARILQRAYLKKGTHDTYAYSIYFQLIVSLFILPVALINHFAIPPLTTIWLQFLLMIMLYAGANIFYTKSVEKTPISEVMVILATMPMWTTVTSILFLGDHITPKQLLGIFLTIIGVAIVFYQKKKFIVHKGHIFAFIATIFFGLALTNDSYLLKHFNQTTYSFLYFFFPALFVACIKPKNTLKIQKFFTKSATLYIGSSALLYAISALLINTSFQIGAQASQVGAMLQLSPIFTIMLGALILKEKEDLVKKCIGGVLVIIGVLLI